MRINHGFILQHKTERGAWTAAQIIALGERWPVCSGWKQRAIAREHEFESLRRFILFKDRRIAKEYRAAYRKKDIRALDSISSAASGVIASELDLNNHIASLSGVPDPSPHIEQAPIPEITHNVPRVYSRIVRGMMEIYFKDFPDDIVRADLRSRRYRWNPDIKAWVGGIKQAPEYARISLGGK